MYFFFIRSDALDFFLIGGHDSSPVASFQVPTMKPTNSRTVQRRPSVSSRPKKKKLFLTDGWEVGLSGVCIYVIRLNTAKQLPEEGFHKDLICGTLDAEKKGLVKSIARIIEYVFIPALAIPQADDEPSADDQPDCPLIKSQLLPELRSFCSCLKGERGKNGDRFDRGYNKRRLANNNNNNKRAAAAVP